MLQLLQRHLKPCKLSLLYQMQHCKLVLRLYDVDDAGTFMCIVTAAAKLFFLEGCWYFGLLVGGWAAGLLLVSEVLRLSLGLQECKAARLQGCKAAWLHGCKAARLQGCKAV